MKRTITREQAQHLNMVAQMDFPTAEAMINGVNLVLGTQYGWLNKRVVFKNETGTHDAYACAEQTKWLCPWHNIVDGSKPENYDSEWKAFYDKLRQIKEIAVSEKLVEGDFYDVWTYVLADGSVWEYTISNEYMLDYSIEKVA
ncbi:MAG: hypothetical protein IKH75_01315 [Ruminococcus sp.]|nr:hypothetical protein [Ruminococcus sp.]